MKKWIKTDFVKANAIMKLIESDGYKALASAWLAEREILIAKATDDKCLNRDFSSGALKGFNQAIDTASKIIEEAIKQKGNSNARNEIDKQFEN